MIDLHSHLLPAVDDGSRSVEQSIKVLGDMARHGVTDVCLTPHVKSSRAVALAPVDHDEAFAALMAAAPTTPRLHRGAEVMLDRPLSAVAGRARYLTLAGTRYVLVEYTRMVALDTISQGLVRVLSLGLIPLLAHPERYSSCSVEAARYWRELGARMQVDATTLTTTQARGDRARALVGAGMADILAGDNHGDDRSVATGYRLLAAQGARDIAELLVVRNPAAILEDRALEPVPGVTVKRTFRQKIRRLFEGEA